MEEKKYQPGDIAVHRRDGEVKIVGEDGYGLYVYRKADKTLTDSGTFYTNAFPHEFVTKPTIESIIQAAADTTVDSQEYGSCVGCGLLRDCTGACCPALLAAVVEAAIEAARDV